jgi:hypothetical protein
MDVNGGRESWRVLVTASSLSFLVAIAVAIGQRPL